jgi:uncharacterized protein
MKVLLDTNILLAIVPKQSKYRWAYDALRAERFSLVVSNDILAEYEEQLGNFYSPRFAVIVLEELLNLPNIYFADARFHFYLIAADPDDDKFVDAAVVSNADHIVTQDKHFNVLRDIPFPKISVITLDEFQEILFA